MELDRILFGDCRASLRVLAAEGVRAQVCVTSPPYFGLRDYQVAGQIGLEATPAEYIDALVEVFREVREVLADDGTLWLVIGDSYAANRGYQVPSTLMNGEATNRAQAAGGRPQRAADYGVKPKDLIGIPWMLAFALRADGWYLRSDIVWSKGNPMPESVTDRPTKSHEYVFLLAKSERYFYDAAAISEPAVSDHPSGNGFRRDARLTYRDANGARGNDQEWSAVGGRRNRRTVWQVNTRPYKGAHFATFPVDLVEPCVLAGSRAGDVVLDPFMGSGTTAAVAIRHGRPFIGCELNPAYRPMQDERIAAARLELAAAQREQAFRAAQIDLFGGANAP
ncbi:DNA-methyltransferase [Paraburkholderia sp. MM6662-R1]|uniref:DNA-methyltransferase n=1 Tax=Paraburkholderia sp. MM6662-R1 TaxID=2991066 RepID=UPI003D20C622